MSRLKFWLNVTTEGVRGFIAFAFFFAALIIVDSYLNDAEGCTAFFDYEYTKGMNKICVYDHLGSPVAITLKSYKLCPLSIQADH